jgi:hypothetical protein
LFSIFDVREKGRWMKRLLVSCVMVMTFGFAQEYTQADRIFDMQKMAQAMQDIQSGFFYNNLDIVKAGAKDLKETIVKIRPIKKETENKKRIQRKIEQNTDDIVARFSDGDATQALQFYSKISSECMKCHVRLRKW